jgi:hypothetical protein
VVEEAAEEDAVAVGATMITVMAVMAIRGSISKDLRTTSLIMTTMRVRKSK